MDGDLYDATHSCLTTDAPGVNSKISKVFALVAVYLIRKLLTSPEVMSAPKTVLIADSASALLIFVNVIPF